MEGLGMVRPSPHARVRILRLRPNQASFAMLLDQPEGWKLHWVDGSMPCLAPNCPWCPMRSYTRWYAPALLYMTIPDIKTWKHFLSRYQQKPDGLIGIVELTEENMIAIGELESYGLLVRLERGHISRQSKAPQSLEVLDTQNVINAPDPSTIPNTRDALQRLWGIDLNAAKPADNEPSRYKIIG